METVLITGGTGLVGQALTDLLLSKGYKIIGTKRRTSLLNTDRVDHLYNNPNFKLEYFDLNDQGSMYRMISQYQPDEIYNLAAQSHVKVSFEIPEYTAQVDALGSSKKIADLGGFSATAMFTAYQSYLQIYINGISRKNFAYSFNSIANYDYSLEVPNNQQVKQRMLDKYQYLFSGYSI